MWKKKLKMGKASSWRLRWSQKICRETCYKQDIPNGMPIKNDSQSISNAPAEQPVYRDISQATGSIGASSLSALLIGLIPIPAQLSNSKRVFHQHSSFLAMFYHMNSCKNSLAEGNFRSLVLSGNIVSGAMIR